MEFLSHATLPGDPPAAGDAARKAYVDSKIVHVHALNDLSDVTADTLDSPGAVTVIKYDSVAGAWNTGTAATTTHNHDNSYALLGHTHDIDGGAPDSTFSTTIDGGSPDTVF